MVNGKETIDILVDGSAATGGPPLGPALGPTGVNVKNVVDEINKKTSEYKGMKVPVKIIIDIPTKTFEIKVGSPPTSALIKKEIGIEKGTKDGSVVGDISFDKVVEIAKKKKESILAKDIKGAVKEVIGVCKTLGVNIEGTSPKEINSLIDSGKYNDKLKE